MEQQANEVKATKRRLWLTFGLGIPVIGIGSWFSNSRRGGFGGRSRSSGG